MKLLQFTVLAISFTAFGFFINTFINQPQTEMFNPFVSQETIPELPLLQYSIVNLKNREYSTSQINIEAVIKEKSHFTSYLFSYQTMNKKMTGQINVPDSITASPTQKKSIIVMLRGFVPIENYQTGTGTKHMAEVLANSGYITVAPDFLGFANSDPASTDSWEARFEKVVNIIELIKSLEKNGVPINSDTIVPITNLGIWAHSNGGQIALTTLEVLNQDIPTSLWAPVTAPFPYSILYFTDELEDEGKATRKWLNIFEEKYDVFEFSLTKHLELLNGPIQIQHGTNDDASLIYWSREFKEKINQENQRRKENNQEKLEFNLIELSNNNHNMMPNWNKASQQDLRFFALHLK